MRFFLLILSLVFPSISLAGDPAEGWGVLGTITASLDGEETAFQVLTEPDGKPHAFQIDAGGPKIISIDGHVLSASGTPTRPSLGIDVLTMGPMTMLQEVALFGNAGSSPEMWIMQEGVGEGVITDGKLSADGVFTGKLEATLVPWSLSDGAAVSGKPNISIVAKIESSVPEK